MYDTELQLFTISRGILSVCLSAWYPKSCPHSIRIPSTASLIIREIVIRAWIREFAHKLLVAILINFFCTRGWLVGAFECIPMRNWTTTIIIIIIAAAGHWLYLPTSTTIGLIANLVLLRINPVGGGGVGALNGGAGGLKLIQ